MSDDRDILGKADALLRRHVPPRTESIDDVPVLTELITPGAAPPDHVTPGDAPPAAVPLLDSIPHGQPRPGDHAPGEADFNRELVAEVVNAVHARLARDFERRLAQHLVTEFQATVAATLGDLHQDIANAVGDAVAAALARRHGK
jgi:hypothetical protein